MNNPWLHNVLVAVFYFQFWWYKHVWCPLVGHNNNSNWVWSTKADSALSPDSFVDICCSHCWSLIETVTLKECPQWLRWEIAQELSKPEYKVYRVKLEEGETVLERER